MGGIIGHGGHIGTGDVGGVMVLEEQVAEVLKMAQEIEAPELEQAKLIISECSLRKGLTKYGRI